MFRGTQAAKTKIFAENWWDWLRRFMVLWKKCSLLKGDEFVHFQGFLNFPLLVLHYRKQQFPCPNFQAPAPDLLLKTRLPGKDVGVKNPLVGVGNFLPQKKHNRKLEAQKVAGWPVKTIDLGNPLISGKSRLVKYYNGQIDSLAWICSCCWFFADWDPMEWKSPCKNHHVEMIFGSLFLFASWPSKSKKYTPKNWRVNVKSPFLIGDTSSDGCCSILMFRVF